MKRLYWSSLKMMRECPQKYLWHKGHPNHDLGQGFGKKKPLPEDHQKKSEHNKLMGSVLSKVVEDVYNKELWREPKNLMSFVEEIARGEFERLEKRHYCLWTYMTRDDAIEICVEGAKNFLRIMKENRLLGAWNKSELAMTPILNKYVSACGIADLVINYDNDKNVFIFDGKNAMTPGKYEDEDQLRWYAMCFRLEYDVMPKGLGFFYFRYPSTNPPEKEEWKKDYDWTGLITVDCDINDVKRLAKEAIATSKAIHKGKFEANPVPKHCGFCDYEPVCPQRQAQKEANAKKRGLRKPKPEVIVNEDEPAIVSLDFGKKL
jgi:hypothetical protein